MDATLGILGFYFTLVGFIGGIFFTTLDSWYNQVRAKVALAAPLTDAEKLFALRDELISLESSEPRRSFYGVGIFLLLLTLLSLVVPTTDNNFDWGRAYLIYGPLSLTVFAYFIGGLYLLNSARQKIKDAQAVIIDKTNKGK